MFGQWMGENRIVLGLEREEHQMTDKELIEIFEGLKRHKEIIKNIDKDYFFAFGEILLNLIQTQQAEIEKKDKIIDLMSEQLTTPIHSKEWVKKYYERKVENGN